MQAVPLRPITDSADLYLRAIALPVSWEQHEDVPVCEPVEDSMRQIPHLIAACAFALVFSMPGPGQDSPSLGDLARQAQKDKANNAAPKKVFTNDDLHPVRD